MSDCGTLRSTHPIQSISVTLLVSRYPIPSAHFAAKISGPTFRWVRYPRAAWQPAMLLPMRPASEVRPTLLKRWRPRASQPGNPSIPILLPAGLWRRLSLQPLKKGWKPWFGAGFEPATLAPKHDALPTELSTPDTGPRQNPCPVHALFTFGTSTVGYSHEQSAPLARRYQH